jgi:hypothetical protein
MYYHECNNLNNLLNNTIFSGTKHFIIIQPRSNEKSKFFFQIINTEGSEFNCFLFSFSTIPRLSISLLFNNFWSLMQDFFSIRNNSLRKKILFIINFCCFLILIIVLIILFILKIIQFINIKCFDCQENKDITIKWIYFYRK